MQAIGHSYGWYAIFNGYTRQGFSIWQGHMFIVVWALSPHCICGIHETRDGWCDDACWRRNRSSYRCTRNVWARKYWWRFCDVKYNNQEYRSGVIITRQFEKLENKCRKLNAYLFEFDIRQPGKDWLFLWWGYGLCLQIERKREGYFHRQVKTHDGWETRRR